MCLDAQRNGIAQRNPGNCLLMWNIMILTLLLASVCIRSGSPYGPDLKSLTSWTFIILCFPPPPPKSNKVNDYLRQIFIYCTSYRFNDVLALIDVLRGKSEIR